MSDFINGIGACIAVVLMLAMYVFNIGITIGLMYVGWLGLKMLFS